MSNPAINLKRARELRALGLTYREIGKIMADEIGRPVVYQEKSIMNILRAADARDRMGDQKRGQNSRFPDDGQPHS